ncbi:prepilin peptidase [Vibrio sp. 10N.261.51.F12]|uniref:A24 family peptidase n=1 Tax=Vibrio sp. 10N.261.51.F12 TaxID=3229679 RepID=UPI00354CBDC9
MSDYLGVLLAMCVLVSLYDIKMRTISNRLLCLFLLFQVAFLKHEINVESMFIVFSLGLIVYKFGWIGGGDVKYITVLSLSLPINLIVEALLLTAFSGVPLILVYYVKHKFTPGSRIKDVTLPYGVAISIGFYLSILSYHHQLSHS